MWSLISGLVVLSIMIIGACIGYIGAYKHRITSEEAWRELALYARRPPGRELALYSRRPRGTNDTSVKLGVQSDSKPPVTISVSPRNFERITDDMTDPPAYEDLSLPPPYEVAIELPKPSYEMVNS